MSKNEDVIELGSSDEEAKPAPKKRKLPNAMVVIPGQRPLKFVRSNSTIIQKAVNPANIAPLLKKPIMFRNINNNCNAPILKKIYKTPTPAHVGQNVQNNIKMPVAPQMMAINPLVYIKSLTKQITVKKMPSNKKFKSSTNTLQGSKLLTNLPPGLTIKPVSQPSVSGTKRELNIFKPKKLEVSSVEIDEEESYQSSTSSPKWYLRPEDQGYNMQPSYEDTDVLMGNNTDFSMEEQNNMEPDALKYVEIVIEDSPVKHHNETGKESAITIEDSPIKPTTSKAEDIESNSEISDKTPLSKKQLQYPKETNVEKEVVEIEIDMCKSNFNVNDSEEPSCQNLKGQESEKSEKNNDESSIKNISHNLTAETESNEEQNESDEFHPEYQKFIDLCFELENSSDMNKIVDKKIKAYYKQCPKEYIESEEFIEMVSSKMISIKASPEKMYMFIKDIVDELNLHRKMNKVVFGKKNLSKETNEEDIDECSYDYKRQRQIRKLEKTVKKLHRAIQKLEEQELDFEDDEDSVYLLTERYKERLVKVYEKLCQVTNTKMPSEPRIHLEARPGQPSGPAKKLETWVNKKVPIGTPLPFPDFHDVVQCVREANKDDKLGWSEMEIMDEARDLFTRCGRKLQRRRQENEWRMASSRVAHHVDPADNDAELRKKFEENKKTALSKETELLNKYVEKQNQMKLEAVEIGDKEADESPVESGEDDDLTEESSSLDDKQKRKHTLKKLIEEKTKKSEEKKINSQDIEDTLSIDETKVTDINIAESNTNKSNNDESENMEVNKSIDEDKHEEKETDPDKDDMRDSDDGTNASGVDELNLLEKLYSENEINYSQESSDSDASVITLDTIELDSDTENSLSQPIDVISIENSSYSENESSMDCHDQDSIKSSTEKTNEEIVENILLASSDDEETSCAEENIVDCINLRDDNISITETTLDGESVEKQNVDSVFENNATQISEFNVNNDSNIANCDENSADSLTCLNDDGVNSEVQNIVDACGSDVNNVDSQINKEKVQDGCIDDHGISNEASVNNEINVKENESNNQNPTVSC